MRLIQKGPRSQAKIPEKPLVFFAALRVNSRIVRFCFSPYSSPKHPEQACRSPVPSEL